MRRSVIFAHEKGMKAVEELFFHGCLWGNEGAMEKRIGGSQKKYQIQGRGHRGKGEFPFQSSVVAEKEKRRTQEG